MGLKKSEKIYAQNILWDWLQGPMLENFLQQ